MGSIWPKLMVVQCSLNPLGGIAHPAKVLGAHTAKAETLFHPFPVATNLQKTSSLDSLATGETVIEILCGPSRAIVTAQWADTLNQALHL